MTDPTDRSTDPLTPEEERRHRQYVEAACREVNVVRGGMFDMALRLFATLDAARASASTVTPDGLREAWAEAEAALPAGHAITELRRWRDARRPQRGDHDYGIPSPSWIALAGVPFTRGVSTRGYGGNPGEALRSLAAALRGSQ